jgi:hypothetical protein
LFFCYDLQERRKTMVIESTLVGLTLGAIIGTVVGVTGCALFPKGWRGRGSGGFGVAAGFLGFTCLFALFCSKKTLLTFFLDIFLGYDTVTSINKETNHESKIQLEYGQLEGARRGNSQKAWMQQAKGMPKER